MRRDLFRDPVYDGATDPLVVIREGVWWMFYTQRRASHPDPGPGVTWVHGTRIGVACSSDGVRWTYAGTLEPDASGLSLVPGAPPAVTTVTHWAPEVIHDGRRWRMYLTEIDGVPDRWEGFARRIVEYVSDDVASWHRVGPLELSSDRVIDAAVARCPDGRWRIWYKDEAADSVTMVASSPDLRTWTLDGVAIGGRPHEGPSGFALGGWWWMIVDEWRGMGVYRSADAVGWERQGGADQVILGARSGAGPLPRGHHGAPVREGDRLWYYFFGHPSALGDATREPDGGVPDDRRSAVFRVELRVADGILTVVE
ncbi:MAG: hypothetical protein ABS62_04455 [Microbacterium sp. SCN 70-200]|uniref:hypothetical protein n=1 Tax=unclassified Microbacterium TaxID=2609290 RepID=UPI000869A573|nr:MULTISPECIES: hypothetical protein [unclassified Microbacterium]ODT42015.1 MAG: hypothetical protein ABS62_04455 [Microbacterium sp. SCN 70-200]OJV79500.1 MAG: hypothetical protein BGO46_04105 [Microbacterium sp. 70-16]